MGEFLTRQLLLFRKLIKSFDRAHLPNQATSPRMLLSFHQEIIADVLANDVLLIMSKGLGIQRILQNLIQMFVESKGKLSFAKARFELPKFLVKLRTCLRVEHKFT